MPKMRVVQVTSPNGRFEIVEREIPEPGAGSVRIKIEACGICHSDAMTKEGSVAGYSIPTRAGARDRRSHRRGGRRRRRMEGQDNASASAGTADTAATAIRAGAATSLPAKLRCRFPVSPTTAATPNT